MADQALFCIQCGAQQPSADARFCHRCGQPIVPVKPGRRQLPPWAGPVLVSAGIVLVAAVVFARLLTGGPTTSEIAAATSAPPAAAGTVTPATVAQSLGDQVTPPRAAATPMPETPAPPATETPQPTPTLANVTPEPLRLTSLAWSPDGKLLAIGSATGAYIYDTSTWQEIRFVPLKVGAASSSSNGARNVVFSFDSALLGTEGDEIMVWRVTDGSFAYTLKGQRALAASPIEGLWATFNGYGGNSGRLQLWRTNDGQLERDMPTGRQYGILQGVFFSPDGQLIATTAGETDGFVVSRVADGSVLSKAPPDTFWSIYGVDLAFRPGTSAMAYIGSDDMLGLWDARTGALIRQLSGPSDMTKGPVAYRVDFAPDGASFATLHSAGPGVEGGTIQVWQADGTRGRSWALPATASDVIFSPDGRLLAVLTGQSLYLYNPDDGSVVHQVEPVWCQGVLPTPTPTPLAVTAPGDWKKYVRTEDQFAISYPPYWTLASWGTDHADFVAGRASEFKPESSMIVSIRVMGSCGLTLDGASNTRLMDELKRTDDEQSITVYGLRGSGGRVLIASGKWPLLIPGLYAEFDTTLASAGSRVVREIRLLAAPVADHCVIAYLLDEPGDITEQTRLDLARMVGSMEFGSPERPFPTATPTNTPTPNPAPRPALPLQISFDAKTSRSSSGGGNAEITIEIKDTFGNPVNEAEVTFSCGWGCRSVGLSRNGRYTTSYSSTSDENQTIKVEIRWNQEIIAQQEFVISWR